MSCVIKIFPKSATVFLLPIVKVQLAKSSRMGVALGDLQRALTNVTHTQKSIDHPLGSRF